MDKPASTTGACRAGARLPADPHASQRRQIQDVFVLDTLSMIYVGASLLFFIDTIYTGMTTSGIEQLINIPLGLLATAIFFTLYRLIAVGRITHRWANRLGALTMILAVGYILIQHIMMPDAPTMLMVMGFTLIAISSGIVFLERRWVVGTLAVIIGGWSLVLALNGQSVPWNHYTYIYVMTTLFTLFNYSGRKRAVAAMVDAQVNNELQRNQLVDALERAHLSEARLRAERDFADQIVKSVGQGVVLLDANGRIEFMNPAAERIIQLPAALLIGRRVADLFSPDSNDTGVHFEFDGENSQELTITFANGEVRSALVSSTSQPGGGNIVTLTDLTLRKQFESKLERLAHYDALTDLPNRALFLDRLRQAINWLARHDGLLAVMFLDLDGFKRINDTLGHAVGDQVLVEVARRIEQCTREQDTAARFGGDEFVVLLTDLDDADEAHRIAARLAESISAPIVLEGELYVIEASIGVALCHAANVEPEDLIERADIAMYRSKHRGDARWQIFTPEMLPGKPAAGSLDLDSRRPIVART